VNCRASRRVRIVYRFGPDARKCRVGWSCQPVSCGNAGGVAIYSPGHSTRPLLDPIHRNALDRWLQQQGWQLAWKIDDDLPLEFNATFSGDFKSVLTQVMQATNHMRTPTRVCKHTNNVIRVVARAANCQD
jgi:hypothetical protein